LLIACKVKVVKNKVAPPFRFAEFEIIYSQGISKLGEMIDIGVEHNLVEKSGSWYSYNSVRIGQGKENAKVYLTENPETANEIEMKIREILGMPCCDSGSEKKEKKGKE